MTARRTHSRQHSAASIASVKSNGSKISVTTAGTDARLVPVLNSYHVSHHSRLLHKKKNKNSQIRNKQKVNWPSAKIAWGSELSNLPFERIKPPIYKGLRDVNIVKPDMSSSTVSELKVTWLGHASVLFQFPPARPGGRGTNILCDPIFETRASPLRHAGPKRRLSTPCTLEELPHIDIVCISHNHYDHMDIHCLRFLAFRPKSRQTRFLVGTGNARYLTAAGIPEEAITQLGWWESASTINGSLSRQSAGVVEVICAPTQHNSFRLNVKPKAECCSWIIRQKKASSTTCWTKVYFGGDTGFRASSTGPVCPAFTQIGTQYGPFDVAAIPVWRGAALAFLGKIGCRLRPEAWTRRLHATPQDAVDIARALRAKTSLAIHHSTFTDVTESLWTLDLLKQACDTVETGMRFRFDANNSSIKTNGIPDFVVGDIGQTFRMPMSR